MVRRMLRLTRVACCWSVLCASLVLGAGEPAHAQYARAEKWTTLVEHEGVEFRFLFYSTADSYNNGVVLLLYNRNDYGVRYRFRIVFRTADGEEHVEAVEGTLDAGEILTGDEAGLYFIPFTDGRTIGEVGLRGYAVTRMDGT